MQSQISPSSPALKLVAFVLKQLPSAGRAEIAGWKAVWDVEPTGTHALVRITAPREAPAPGTRLTFGDLRLYAQVHRIRHRFDLSPQVKDGALLFRVPLQEPVKAEAGWYMDTDEEGNPRAIAYAGAA